MAQKFLGVDFGTKRVGLAVSDDDGYMAFPKTVLENEPALASKISAICREEGISAVVIGESLDYKGGDNPIMKKIAEFKAVLEKETGLPVYLEPEFLTSAEAGRIQGEGKFLDASAAAIILQSFLDKMMNKNQIKNG